MARHRLVSVVLSVPLETIVPQRPLQLRISDGFRCFGADSIHLAPSIRSVAPRLLVSVRSTAEATAALAGGCDILDVKEPSRGPLGAADPGTIAAICEAAQSAKAPVPVSVALGELREWPAYRPVLQITSAAAFAKLGLSGCASRSDWSVGWIQVRKRIDESLVEPIRWIAVLYADAAADGPEPGAIIDLAATTGCCGVLVDTFRKDCGRLHDHVADDTLAGWRSQAAAAGLTFAVAGSLRPSDLPRVAPIRPDIVAIRGAACRSSDRLAEVDTDAVRDFQAAMVRAARRA